MKPVNKYDNNEEYEMKSVINKPIRTKLREGQRDLKREKTRGKDHSEQRQAKRGY